MKTKLEKNQIRSAWLFLSPMIIVLILTAAWPLFKTFYYGFTDALIDALDTANFIWFENYLTYVDYGGGEGEWFGVLADSLWWYSVWNTLKFTFISVSLETFFGLIVALILNQEFKGRGFVRAAILVPWAIPTIVSAKMWSWMLNDQFGIINEILLSLRLIGSPIAWLADIDTAMGAVILVDVWKTTPFMALLILAAMQILPKDIYEVAKIDNIHPIKKFFSITLPLIKPALIVAIIFRSLDALRIFDLIYVLTPGKEETISMSIYARQNLFEFDKFAYGSAVSSMLFVIIMCLTITYMYFGKLNFSKDR